MNEVHAPYHFVPLSKWVYMPDWAHLVSHDVPFKDGYSGVIEYTLTNTTPLCVGGIQEKNTKPTLVKWHRNPLNHPVIPGSSLKGMLRNTIEIACFGKLNNVDDHHLSFRDISNAETRYSKEIRETTAQAYWIKFDETKGDWTFRKAEHTVLFHKDLNNFAGIKIQNVVEEHGKTTLINAEIKYQQYGLDKPSILFDLGTQRMTGTKGKDVNVECAVDLGKGPLQGYPVFSGYRPGKKEHTKTRLNFSYMFYAESTQTSTFSQGSLLVKKLFENHGEALVSHLKNHPHPSLGIPVFAREDKQGKIVALGFAKMPRKLYEQSTHKTIANTQKLSQSIHTFDIAELMFGTLREHGFSLKSRISFSDASCSVNQGITTSAPVILGAPKSSYLAAYVEQNANQVNTVTNEFKQYERGSQIKGWKRYPSQSEFKSVIPNDLQKKIDVQSQMELMKPSSQFKGKIVFHNLKIEELGALIWAMQFKDFQGNQCQHSLGHGKPLGAGSVHFNQLSLHARGNSDGNTVSIDDCIANFTAHMNQAYPDGNETGWQDSAQLMHLLAFADQVDNQGKDLTYMPLNTPNGSSIMSYTASNKGREKKSLPDWQHQHSNLLRSESIEQKAPGSFAKGRLADLISLEKEIPLSGFENGLIQSALAEKKQNEFAQLSVYEQQFEQLKEKLNQPEVKASKEGRQSCNKQIDDLLTLCIDESVEDDFIGELIALCKDTTQSAYLDLANNKKNKPKLQARKEKLATLAAKYQLGV